MATLAPTTRTAADTAQAGNARIGASPDILEQICKDACNLAVWERAPIAGLDTIVTPELGSIRFTSALELLDDQLLSELRAAGYPENEVIETLAQDIGELAARYAAIYSHTALELRLDIITTNSCRKFHADYVGARLITSYVGRGTDWLSNDDADRVALGKEPVQIHSLKPGDVGLFKGKMATERPAIHRSPPIEGTGETRLLLVLNPAC